MAKDTRSVAGAQGAQGADTNPDELIKVCLRVRKSDYEFIRDMASASRGDVSINLIARKVLETYVRQLRSKEREVIDQGREAAE